MKTMTRAAKAKPDASKKVSTQKKQSAPAKKLKAPATSASAKAFSAKSARSTRKPVAVDPTLIGRDLPNKTTLISRAKTLGYCALVQNPHSKNYHMMLFANAWDLHQACGWIITDVFNPPERIPPREELDRVINSPRLKQILAMDQSQDADVAE